MESWQDYRIGTRTTYSGRGTLINIGKVKDNFNKDKRPKCFNCNTYRCMTKKCQRSKKEWDMRKCYKCNKVEYIAKNCWAEQKIKNRSIQKELDKDQEKDDKQEGFAEGLE